MTTIPTYEEDNKDNVPPHEMQNCETIEAPQVLHDAEPPQEIENNEAKNIYDLCPPSIKREIMTRLTKKKILLYDPDMQTPEALEVIVRVKEAYDRKKQRSCNDLKNKRLAKQTTIEIPAEEPNVDCVEEPEEKYEPAEVLQPAKIELKDPVKQVRKQAKKVVKKEVIENQEPQTPRNPPPQISTPVNPHVCKLFKSEVATIPRVSTKLFM